MSARLPPPPREIDLDSTDELPVIRIPSLSEEPLSATDDFAVGALPGGVAELADRLRELERRLEQREDRIAQLEATIGDALNRELALRTELDAERHAARDHATASNRNLADAERELVTVRNEFDRREADLLAAQVEIDGQRRALAHARMEVEQRAHAFRHQAMDLAELRNRSERLHEAVQTALGLRAADQQHLAAVEAQRDELLRQVEALRAGSPPAAAGAAASGGAPDPADAAELAGLRAGAEAARAAIAVYEEQQHQIGQLQGEVARLQQRIVELEAGLAAQVERAAQAELTARAELAAQSSGLGSTQDVVVTPDIVVTQDTLDPSIEDSGTRPGLRALVLGQGTVPLRVLVRQEGGEEIRYPLGRRTTIGRTPDNDIQIDTTYVSRHHAVVLSNAQDCVVEDLNSTNGVLVNGRRVGRHSLRDGDSLLIGNTVFSFHQHE
jgi:hypothetical protein